MDNHSRPTLDEYWDALNDALPRFTPEEQRAAVALYEELSKGKAVSRSAMSAPMGLTEHEAVALLARPGLNGLIYERDGAIVGFGGLATEPLHHAFHIGGRQLWTWCAWDSLFLPRVLGMPARVESKDPVTGKQVSLEVSPTGIESAEPSETVLSFVQPDADFLGSSAANVMGAFCHYVFFFEAESSAERWKSTHPGTFVFSLDEASELARRLTERNFRAALTGVRRG